jgi:tetratricopeptide (TPR) repeat protein
MLHPRLTALVLAAAAFVAPSAARAHATGAFTPPRVLTRGTNTTPAAGAGAVRVKVLVKANGTAGSVTVVKSSNPADDAAATEVAQTSKYAPGKHAGKPDAVTYYTVDVSFAAAGGSADVIDAAALKATMERSNAYLRAGKYDQAKALLGQYLRAAPDDPHANLLLGVADAYSSDTAAAAAAFDKAGTIPSAFSALAVQTYFKAAAESLAAKNYDDSIAYSTRLIALTDNADAYNERGTAELEAHKYDAAIADLEKARVKTATLSVHSQAVVLANLGTAYAATGQIDKASEISKQVLALDPSVTNVQDAIAQVQSTKARAASAQGDYAGAMQIYDAAAPAVGKYALTFYDDAALAGFHLAKPDWKAIKAEADKALAIDPNDVTANYVAGYALSQQNDSKAANPFFVRAQTAIKNGAKVTDPTLPGKIDAAVKQTASGT